MHNHRSTTTLQTTQISSSVQTGASGFTYKTVINNK